MVITDWFFEGCEWIKNVHNLYFDALTLLSFTIKVSESCPMYCCYIKNTYLWKGIKKTGFITSNWKLGEERPGLHCKITKNMEYDKFFFDIPNNTRAVKAQQIHHSSYQTDCRKTRKHYSFKNHSRIDSWILGLFVEQRIWEDFMERLASCLPVYAQINA